MFRYFRKTAKSNFINFKKQFTSETKNKHEKFQLKE